MKRHILSALGIALLAIVISTALPVQTQPQPAQAQQASDKYDGDCTGLETAGRCADKPFDHSNCQYPLRTTNPPYGCDNSDPANPYCAAKGLPEDCQEGLPTPTETPAPARVSECEGK